MKLLKNNISSAGCNKHLTVGSVGSVYDGGMRKKRIEKEIENQNEIKIIFKTKKKNANISRNNNNRNGINNMNKML